MSDSIDKLLQQAAQPEGGEKEPIKVITVRMPESLHTSLHAEAHDRRTSMNKLALAKLMITANTLDAIMGPAEPPVDPEAPPPTETDSE